jgi:hypothetical protein
MEPYCINQKGKMITILIRDWQGKKLLYTGEDSDPQGTERAKILAEIGVPKQFIHFGDSSHQEQYDWTIKLTKIANKK